MASLAISPQFAPVGLNQVPLVLIGTSTTWLSTGPSLSASASVGSAPTITGGSVATNTLATGYTLNTAACTAGATITITDATSSTSATLTLQACLTTPTTTTNMVGTTGNELSTVGFAGGGGWAARARVVASMGFLTLQQNAAGIENACYNATATQEAAYIALDGAPLGFEQTVSSDIFTCTPTDNSIIGVIGCYDPIAGTYIQGHYRYNAGSPTLQIFTFTAGSGTNVGGGTITGTIPTVTASTKYTLVLKITLSAISITLNDHTGTFIAAYSIAITLGVSTNLALIPGYAGIVLNTNVSGVVGATTTTGWRIGPCTATAAPRSVLVNVQSGADFPNIPCLCITKNYIILQLQDAQTSYNNNTSPSDTWIYRVPIATPFAIPAKLLLINTFSGNTALINQYTGTAGISQNCTMWWLPGVGAGTYGRVVAVWTEFHGCSEQGAWPGINNATSASLWSSYSDDEGVTWHAATDITSSVKGSTWCSIEAGPGNCNLVLANGNLFTTLWFTTPVSIPTLTFSVTNGSATVTASGSATAFTGANVVFTGDSSKKVYALTASGTSCTISPVYGGTTNGAISAQCVGPLNSNTAFWGSQTVCMTTSATDGTGWSIGGRIDNHFAGGNVQPNEAQAIQLPNGNLFAVERFQVNSPTNTQQFASSTDNGATWASANPASFPISTPTCTVGLLNYYGIIIYVGPNGLTRAALTAAYSLDSGATWSTIANPTANVPGGTLFSHAGTGYASLGILPTGDLLMFWMINPTTLGLNPVISVFPTRWLGIIPPSGAANFNAGFNNAFEGGVDG